MNPLKKQKKIMKTKNMIWAALSMTAALVMTACTNDDNAVETPAAPQAEVKTIPYTVTVSQGGDAATTRATVDSDNKTLYFADGDKLYVTGTNISGTLDIQTGTGTASATFSGDLTYTGEGTPASDLSLTATLVSAQQTDGTEVTINPTTKAVTVNYPTTAYCDDVATAVQKYSNLTGTSNYGSKSFTLSQQTAFLNFVITFADGTTTGTGLSAVVKNGETTLCTANRTTTTESEKVVAKFVLPVASGTALSGATVKMGTKAALAITDATLAGKVYNVKRTLYYKEVTLGSGNIVVPAGEHWNITGSNSYDSNITIGEGATVTLSGVTMLMNSEVPCIKCSGDATIILADGTTNTLTAEYDGGGIQAGPTGTTLTIKGNTGVLNVEIKHSLDAAAIGAYNKTACGDIVIEGGVINATSQNGAAIGARYQAACGDITISGGTVTAKAGGADDNPGVGIGGHYDTACGDITITGGTVTATGFNEPGIGGDNKCGDITISGGTVKATKGEYADMCIGLSSDYGTCGTITIGGTVYWDGSNYQNGGGSYLTQSTITYPAP